MQIGHNYLRFFFFPKKKRILDFSLSCGNKVCNRTDDNMNNDTRENGSDNYDRVGIQYITGE